MKYRATAALAAVAALAALTACSSSDDDAAPKKTTTPAVSQSADTSAAEHSAGIPPEPTGQARENLLTALRRINPDLIADEGKAIDNSRNQCSAINGASPKVDWSAQQRFGTSSHEVSDAEAKQINAALATFCKTA
ncbi:hypothetical protein ACF1FE_23445 [Streptomyces griseofuscus]|uniref:hypothetical protein n=1 Tax=Streptomyces griseofuscus TaxID=146922 RepID=UPI0036F4D32C